MSNLTMFRSAVLAEIDGAIYFRSGVAERYPDDERNIQCVESLGRLNLNLEQLTEDDPRMVKCFETYRDKHMAAGNGELNWLDDCYLWFPQEDAGSPSKEEFSRYGFDGSEDGDAGAFLESLAIEIESWDLDDLSYAE